MPSLTNYDLFLFDFDGLLVDTEQLHFAAYRRMCALRGFSLNWDMRRFLQAAHFDASGLKNGIYAEFPELFQQEPSWDVLYREKKQIYQDLLEAGGLQMMPGAAELLQAVAKAGISRAVVTNSPLPQVEAIRRHLPVLETIPVWITRECYKNPKPSPDSYRTALDQLSKPGDKVIGFEDSTRGLTALLASGVQEAVLVSSADHPQMEDSLPKGVAHFATLSDWLNNRFL